MLKRPQRLKKAQFSRAFASAKTERHPVLTLRYSVRNDGSDLMRAAFVVPKKQGPATTRNRTRRKLQEAYRGAFNPQAPALPGFDLLFFAVPATAKASFGELQKAVTELVERVAIKAGPAVSGSAGSGHGRNEPVREVSGTTPGTGAHIALMLIRFYQCSLSPMLPPSCRYYPTCSRYTYDAIQHFGCWRGAFLGMHRICRCNPWQVGGFDPVPDKFPSFRLFRPFAGVRLWLEQGKQKRVSSSRGVQTPGQRHG